MGVASVHAAACDSVSGDLGVQPGAVAILGGDCQCYIGVKKSDKTRGRATKRDKVRQRADRVVMQQ